MARPMCLNKWCRRIRRTGNRRYTSSAWCIRDGLKLLLIALTLTFCALSMLSTSVHTFISATTFPSSRLLSDQPRPPFGGGTFPRRGLVHNAMFYRFHSMGAFQNQPTPSTTAPPPATVPELVNPHNFNYTILETDVCSDLRDPFLITVVHTHPGNYKRRMVIRETWGGSVGFKMIVLFMMGSVSDNPSLMEAVKAESQRYRDIVQETFEDTYRNLTHKAVMWLKWTSTYCSAARYVLKVDDDIFVNTFNLINHLRHLHARGVASRRSILCLVWYRMQVVRNPESKWYVTKDEYPDDHFSNYCSGSAYILTGDLLKAFYEKALQTKFFWIDDFYVTGLLPRQLDRVNYHNIGSLYALKQAEVRDKLVYNNALFGHIPGSLSLRYKLWKEILAWRGLGGPTKNATV